MRVKFPGKTRTSEENVSRVRDAFQLSPRKSIRAASSARRATQKAPSKSVQNSNVSCTKPEWTSSRHKRSRGQLERIYASPDSLGQMCFSD
jgi:hypothetical protein